MMSILLEYIDLYIFTYYAGIMLDAFLGTYYAQNYADIIGRSLAMRA